MNKPDFSKVLIFKTEELNRAAAEGYSARRGGKGKGDNPYPVASMRGAVWEDAWIIADCELANLRPATCSMPFAPGAIEVHVRRVPLWRRFLILAMATLASAAVGFLGAQLDLPIYVPVLMGMVFGWFGVREALK